VLARYDDKDKWEFHHFSHKEGSEFSCDGWTCGQCIPYNETTKHLCGTSDPYIDPAEAPAFEFGDVVGVRFKTKRNMGIFITYSKRHKDFCVVAVERENGEIGMFTKLLKNVEFLRKGNFND
jgi:hypothetical protein